MTKEQVVICCEEMLMQLGKTVFLDSIQWPHLEDEIVGPTLDRCPWCGRSLPFQSVDEERSE